MLTQSRDVKMQTASSTTNTDSHLRAQLELLSTHTTAPISTISSTVVPARGSRPQPLQTAPVKPSHGYSNGSTFHEPSDVLPPIANNNHADPESHIHPELRARTTTIAPLVNMMPAGVPPPSTSSGSSAGPSNSLSSHPSAGAMALDDSSMDGRKAKRELSQSKRAAQNRAAQRAFRQRKEGYIKKLEQQVRDYMEMEHNYKTMQSENYALREYVIHLQSRLLDSQGEYPQPPPNINLNQPPAPPAATNTVPEAAPSNPAAGTPLEAVAQAVAGLAAQEQLAERQHYTQGFKPEPAKDDAARTAEEIDRQLRTDGLSAPTASM